MVAALAGHHRVIRIDLPGCGHSPPAPSYDVPAQAGRVAALLDGLGLRDVAVAAPVRRGPGGGRGTHRQAPTRSARNGSGSTALAETGGRKVLPTCTSKCRWGSEELPLEPT